MKIPESTLRNIWLIFIIITLFLATSLPYWFFVVSVSVVFISPLILEFKRKNVVDERQIAISHLSSHITFYVFILLLLLTINREYISKGLNPPPQFYMLMIVPFVVKLLASLYMDYGAVPTAQWIGYFFSFFWLLFVILSHGLSFVALIESVPFVLIFLISFFSKKFPGAGGILFLVFSATLLIFFRGWSRLDLYTRILMYSLIPLPLVSSGTALLWYRFKSKNA
ncbi:hypothetical protein JXA84_06380 [candidate division WOR-3 bacterium]|nr:hypothetical protein [candidate division WOR-3 bacterium]